MGYLHTRELKIASIPDGRIPLWYASRASPRSRTQANLSEHPRWTPLLAEAAAAQENFAQLVPNPPSSGEDAQRISPPPQKQYQSPRKMPRLLS